MNALQQARAGYDTAVRPIRTPRGAEYDAFARITSRMKSASNDPPARFRDLASAIQDNRRLWTLLAADAADQDNPLPKELRARIISLAEFTRVHSGKVLRSGATAQPLIEINVAVMQGLHENGQPT